MWRGLRMDVTIVGGGFGGVKAALELAKDHTNQITLITDRPYFQYYPALYGAATGGSHLQSWVPLGEIFEGINNVTIIIDKITSINPAAKHLTSERGLVYNYVTCVLALGTVTTYFGIKGLDRYSFGIKSADEVKALQKHIYDDVRENNIVDKRYVIIGAGPTGVELAGAMGSYIRQICKEFKVTNSKIHIDLIEAAPRVLPKMSPQISQAVSKRLRRLGVYIHTNRTVESADDDVLTVDGKTLMCHTVIWTSGVANHPFYQANKKHFLLAKNGRVAVNEFMQTKDGLYVIGDNAATPHSGLAQTALHDALFVASDLKRQREGSVRKAYHAVKPPIVVPIGAYWAAVEWHSFRMSGWFGSVIRKAADFMGYSDILPIGHALGVWRAGREKHK